MVVVLALASCTSSPSPALNAKTTTAAYARYFFVAPNDTGVLEVTANPPTICYSTQSYPARPIIIVTKDQGTSRPVATYQPERGTFCDRHVSDEVAAGLIATPSSFAVRWSPQAGQSVIETALAAVVT